MRGRVKNYVSPWTPKIDAKLREMYATEMSAADIAKALGPQFTKGSVVGRASKLRLPHKPRGPVRQKDKKEKAPSEIRDRLVSIPKNGVCAGVTYDGFLAGFCGAGISLLTARADQCRWPIEGRAQDGLPQCCGAAASAGRSYCPKHCAAAFRVMRDWREMKAEAA